MGAPTTFRTFSHTAIGNEIAAPGALPSGTAGAVRSRGRLFAMMVATPLALLFLIWAPVALAVDDSDCLHLVVINTADAGPGSLRQALANVCAGGTITFAPELTASGPATITLTSAELTIATTMTFEGPGASLLAVSGNNEYTVFRVVPDVTAVITGLTIRDGVSKVNDFGGGIYNAGILTLQGAVVVSNVASYGGGIYNTGALTLTATTIAENWGEGAGVCNVCSDSDVCTVYVLDSMIRNNDGGSGSGLLNLGSRVNLVNTTVMSNGLGWGMQGGGIVSFGTLELANSVVKGNHAEMSGGGILSGGVLTVTNTVVEENVTPLDGGGIYIQSGPATIENSTVNANIAEGWGGGIYTEDSITVRNSVIFGNRSKIGGGGIYVYAGYYEPDIKVALNNCTVMSNTANYGGGGIYNRDGAITVANSTVNRNTTGGNGGGICNSLGVITVANSTINENTAGRLGGGISNDKPWTPYSSTMTLTQVTVSGNHNGGIWNWGVLNLRNTIVANSAERPDYEAAIEGVIGANAGNLVEDGSLQPALTGDPRLGEFGDYGGPTWTLPLLPGSPALGAGAVGACLATDQRGVARPATGCDIGAFESQGFTLTVIGGDHQKVAVNTIFANPLAVTVAGHAWEGKVEPIAGGVVRFFAPGLPAPGLTTTPTATAAITGTQAALLATANPVAGSYVVSATTADGGSAPVLFHLENLPSPFEAAAQTLLPAIDK